MGCKLWAARPRVRGSIPGRGKRFYTSTKRRGGRVSHPTYLLSGDAFLLGVNWAEREADHSLMSSADLPS